MSRVTVDLEPRDEAALKRFVETQPGRRLTGREAAQLLLRDALIGCGCMPLGRDNRSRHAGGKRGRI